MSTRTKPVWILFVLLLALGLTACGGSQPPVELPTPTTGAPEQPTPTSQAPEATPELVEAAGLRPVLVESVHVEVGVGSPAAANVMVSGTWPDLCAQLAKLEQRIDGSQIIISLMATPADPNCPPDVLGIPFAIAIPINAVELPVGQYTLNVNGMAGSFDWNGQGPAPAGYGAAIAYIGMDGNLWVIDSGSDQPRQLTQDATPIIPSSIEPGIMVSYTELAISSDGMYLAARRDVGTPITEGYHYDFGLWVYNLSSGEAQQVSTEVVNGFSWKPGTHLLAYGQSIAEGYFSLRGDPPDASLAKGIAGFDMDTQTSSVLVNPEAGLSLILPIWSPDGRYLGFNEVVYMEGRGPFDYYDFTTQQYVTFEDEIGGYDWSPAGDQIAYDRQNYTATGEERIFLSSVPHDGEQQFSPDLSGTGSYSNHPKYSPDGQQIAYAAVLGGPDSLTFNLYVQSLAGGAPRDLGSFDTYWNMQWMPDGQHILLSVGPYDNRQVFLVSLADGGAALLANGFSAVSTGR